MPLRLEGSVKNGASLPDGDVGNGAEENTQCHQQEQVLTVREPVGIIWRAAMDRV